MPQSIPDKILDVIATRVETVEPTYTKRPPRGGIRPYDRSVTITHSQIVPNAELSCPGNPPLLAFDLPVMIHCLMNPSETASDPIDKLLDDYAFEVYRAIASPAASWHTMGGNAINSVLGEFGMVDTGDDTIRGIGFMLTVTFRVEETDPFTLQGG